MGGLRFTMSGSSHYYQVLITNVGEDGEVVAVKVKGSKTGWLPMARNWGQNWQSNVNLKGQPLSFEVTTSDRRTLTLYNVAPATWMFGQTFEGKQFGRSNWGWNHVKMVNLGSSPLIQGMSDLWKCEVLVWVISFTFELPRISCNYKTKVQFLVKKVEILW